MAQTVCVLPPAEDRKRLLAIVADRNRPLKHVRRAHIVLCSADCLPVQEVARRARVSRPAVWRWQQRSPPRKALRVCCATRPVRPASRQCRKRPRCMPRSSSAPCAEPPGAVHPLDRPRHGQSRRRQPARRSALVGGAPAAAAPHSHLQALQRSRVRREGRGHRRPLHGPAQARGGRLDRREEPVPGATHAAGLAA